MILSWIHTFLGAWGTTILDFYNANSLWINLIILAYGAWIVFSWSNLKRIRSILVWSLVQQMNSLQTKAATELTKKMIKQDTVIPWKDAVEQVRFPFVAHQLAFWPRRLSVEAVQTMLPSDDLIVAAKRIIQQQTRKKKIRRGEKIASR